MFIPSPIDPAFRSLAVSIATVCVFAFGAPDARAQAAAGGHSGHPAAPAAEHSASGHSAPTANAAPATSVKVGKLSILAPWARATAPGAPVGGGYLVLDNAGDDDRLLGASSPVSAKVELHTMSMENNLMRMRQLPSIDVPAGKRVELRPGELHMMLIDLKAPLKEGETFPLTLRFEKAGEVEVRVEVRAMGASGPGNGHGGHGGGHGAHGSGPR